jgi:hypothetical protein
VRQDFAQVESHVPRIYPAGKCQIYLFRQIFISQVEKRVNLTGNCAPHDIRVIFVHLSVNFLGKFSPEVRLSARKVKISAKRSKLNFQVERT